MASNQQADLLQHTIYVLALSLSLSVCMCVCTRMCVSSVFTNVQHSMHMVYSNGMYIVYLQVYVGGICVCECGDGIWYIHVHICVHVCLLCGISVWVHVGVVCGIFVYMCMYMICIYIDVC